MANLMKMKRSAVPGKVPTTADLDLGEIAINTYDGKVYMKKNVSGVETIVLLTGAGSGDVSGPASSGDKAIARFSGTGGKTIQNSSATIDDSGNISATSFQASGTGASKMPIGTTAQRPTGAQGMFRFNSTTAEPEWYDIGSSTWVRFADRAPILVELMMIGGGGGGGTAGGGGGAGGMVYAASYPLSRGNSFSIFIGGGGAGGGSWGAAGSPGTDTTLSGGSTSLVAKGGGAGAHGGNGGTGGCGGGSGYGASGTSTATQTSQSGDSGAYGFGNYGGYNPSGSSPYSGAGGGGCGGAGGNCPNAATGGQGGSAKTVSTSGSAVAYGGGGGGGTRPGGTAGAGGGGGAGNGGQPYAAGGNASANSGSGAGGGGSTDSPFYPGGVGGSGVVILRYAGAQQLTGGTITSVGGYTIHTFTTSGTLSS